MQPILPVFGFESLFECHRNVQQLLPIRIIIDQETIKSARPTMSIHASQKFPMKADGVIHRVQKCKLVSTSNKRLLKLEEHVIHRFRFFLAEREHSQTVE